VASESLRTRAHARPYAGRAVDGGTTGPEPSSFGAHLGRHALRIRALCDRYVISNHWILRVQEAETVDGS